MSDPEPCWVGALPISFAYGTPHPRPGPQLGFHSVTQGKRRGHEPLPACPRRQVEVSVIRPAPSEDQPLLHVAKWNSGLSTSPGLSC